MKNNVILGTGSYSSVKSGNTVSVTVDGGNAWNYFGLLIKNLNQDLSRIYHMQKGIKNYNK